MSAEDTAKVVGHQAINMACTGVGSFYSTHNAIVRVLCLIAVARGCVATTSCRGLLGAIDGDDRDTVGDLLIVGLDNSRTGKLVDVSITHPITGKGKAKLQAALITGHAGEQVLAKKSNRYKDLPEESGFDVNAFVMEMSGDLTQPAIDLVKRLAKHYADRIDIMRLSARDTPNALAGRRYSQWLLSCKLFPSPVPELWQADSGVLRLSQLSVPQSRVSTLLPSSLREWLQSF